MIKRILIGLLVILISVPVFGFVYQQWSSMQDTELRARDNAPGKIVTVDGVEMHIHCTGPKDSSNPTLVMIAGYPGMALTWERVQGHLETDYRVCSYDRAGFGWSAAVSEELSAAGSSKRLIALLDKAGEDGPYVLVGHSIGAVFARQVAHELERKVQGVVLVEAAPDCTQVDCPAAMTDAIETARAFMSYLPALNRVGMVRLARPTSRFYDPLSPDSAAVIDAFTASQKDVEAFLGDYLGVDGLLQEVNQLDGLGEMPLLVLIAEDSYPEPEGLAEVIFENNVKLAKTLSSNGSHIVVPQSDHFTIVADRQQASMVAQSIDEFVAQVSTDPESPS